MFGFARSSSAAKTLADVIIPIFLSAAIVAASFATTTGSTRGSSPCTLMTCEYPRSFFATSATRSVPLRCFGEVIATSAPNPNAHSAIRRSSVATITVSTPFARAHRSHTCWISGLPAIRCSGFPGRRVDAKRAGMMTATLGIRRFYGERPRRTTFLLPPRDWPIERLHLITRHAHPPDH